MGSTRVSICQLSTLFYILIIPSYLVAQSGDLVLYSYDSPISNTDNQNLAAIQGKDGTMYFANTKGIIHYDGHNWDIVETYSTPHALALDSTGRIYVGCSDNFGYLEIDEAGQAQYVRISTANQNFGPITQILVSNDRIYYYCDKIVFCYIPERERIEDIWFAKIGYSFAGLFPQGGQVYVNIQFIGLHKLLARGEFIPFPEGNFLRDVVINTCLPYDEETVLIGTEDNLLYLFDGKYFEEYTIESQQYLDESLLGGGIDFKEGQFVLSTLSGGCIIIDKLSGNTLQTINYQTGLADDEVLAICKDDHGGLWICNGYGISRADINLPIRKYSSYPGLEGNITTLHKQDSVLYVGTSEGVFYLAKVDRFEQLVKLVKRERKEIRVVERNIQTTIQVKDNLEEIREDREGRALVDSSFQEIPSEISMKELKKIQRKQRRTLKKLEREKRRAERKGEIISEDPPPNNQPNVPSPAEPNQDTLDVSVQESLQESKPIVKKYTEFVDTPIKETYALQSIPFLFSKIEGINVKCKQILPFQDRLLVVTSLGLYEIKSNTSSETIIKNTPIYFACQSKKDKNRIYLGTDKTLLSFVLKDNQWEKTHELDKIEQIVHSIAENGDTLWIGGEEAIFRVQTDALGAPRNLTKYDLPNAYAENTTVRAIRGKSTFFISTGIYTYDVEQDRLLTDKSLEAYFNPRSKVFFRQPNFTWIQPKYSSWKNINQTDTSIHVPSIFLNFFKDIEDIYVDKSGNLWVVGDNELYQIKAQANLNPYQQFKVEVNPFSSKDKPLANNNLILDYTNNSLKFELTAPFFIQESRIIYQYKLEKQDSQEEWSSWDNNNHLNFAFLSSGRYILHIKARNIFGQESRISTLAFEIKRPFWESWWFMVGAVLLGIFLIYLIIWLRTRALKNANKRLEAKVSEKTQEISAKKYQLEEAFKEISTQKNQIQSANEELQQANLTLEQKVEERTARLKATLLQLLQTNRELDTFIYRSSHDLRGPISRLIGLVMLAKMEENRDTIIKNLNLIEFTAERMTKMLDKLMNVHFINGESIDYEQFDPYRFLDHIKHNLSSLPESDSVYLITKVDVQSQVVTDETLLTIILENLLENAIIFQSEGSEVFPIVKVEFKANEESISITVTDNGQGIPKKHQDHIFEMFYRASSLSKGNGLGLYLVKKATVKLGGRLDFRSEVGNITTFTITLPNALDMVEEETPEPAVIVPEQV